VQIEGVYASPSVHTKVSRLEVQSDLHPSSLPASHFSTPTTFPSPQIVTQESAVVLVLPEQLHPGIGPEQALLHPWLSF